MQFDTSEYERSHGKKPRGRGSWAFEFPYAPAQLRGEPMFIHDKTLTECKAIIRREFPFIKTVKVLP